MWLYIPRTSASLAVQADSSWPSDLLCRQLSVSATSRGKLKRPKSWRRVLRTRLSTTRLSGLTSAPSTVSRGVDLWMESLAASRARTFPWPVSVGGSSEAIAVDSSTNTPGSFGRSNPDGSISKTYLQSSLFQQEELFSESLPPWGSMRNGELFERPTWVPAIEGRDASCWPTARTTDTQSGRGDLIMGKNGAIQRANKGAEKKYLGANLSDVAEMWPTAVVSDGENQPEKKVRSGRLLTTAAKDWWPTALAGDALKGGPNQRSSKGDLTLASHALKWWPTVTVHGDHNAVGMSENSGTGLSTAVKLWSTSQAHDSGQGNAARVGRFATEHGGRNLADDVMLWRTPDAMQCGGAQSAQKRLDGGHALRLQDQVHNWGTPTTRDWKDGDSSQADGPTSGLLGRQVVNWSSPTTTDAEIDTASFRPSRAATKRTTDYIARQAMQWEPSSLPAQPTPSGTSCWCGTPNCGLRYHKRKLNPLFVEMLMGWPLHYTNASIALEPAAMELYLSRARLLLESLCAEPEVCFE